MSDEKMMILKMLKDGKITADEAAKLLLTIDQGDEKKKKSKKKTPSKYLRVRITDVDSNKVRANIRIPLNILKIGSKFGAHFTSNIDGIETDDLMRAIEEGEMGKIVDVYDDEDGEHVEVFIE